MSKGYIYLFLTIGGFVGSYVPVLFGAGLFSPWSILGGVIGGILGIWAAIKYNGVF
ncbi:hypothetical protein HYW35_01580 [Candidatus Saccharibacteria bacterium]|nr:hypothetical protein [Candidatus Saccharibacteria bacterium]